MAKSSSNSTIKFLIFVLLFLVFVLLSLLLFIIPSVKSYKNSKRDLISLNSKNRSLAKEQFDLKANIDEIKAKNSRFFNEFDKKFDENNFKKFAQKFFSDVNLSKVKEQDLSSRFDRYQVFTISKHNSPTDFYAFVDGLQSYSKKIKINFPIIINTQNSKLELKFSVDIYNNTKK